MNEREKHLERENTLFKAFLNSEIEKSLDLWRSLAFPSGRVNSRLNALIEVAYATGAGFTLQINDRRVIGGKTPEMSDKVRKYVRHGTRETLILDIPSREERKRLHSLVLTVGAAKTDLELWSSRGSEALFPREDVLSLEVR